MFGQIASYRPESLASVTPWATLAACAGLVTGDIVLSAITPGYNMVGDTNSQLMSSDARYSLAARIILGFYAVLLVPFALSLPNRFTGRPILNAFARAAIWIHIAAALISALALNDSDAGLVGGLDANEIHDGAAIVMFGAALATLVGFAPGYWAAEAKLRRLTYSSLAILLILGPAFVAEVWTDVNGVMERALALAFMAWLAGIAWSWRHESDRRPVTLP